MYDLSKIDWAQLRIQKMHLLAVIADLENYGEDEQDKDTAEALTGILHLIDSIQDAAAEDGLPVKWLSEENPEPVQNLRVRVRFRPQAWVFNYAVGVDLEGRQNVWLIEEDSVTLALDADANGLDLDFLKFDPFAPKWVAEYDGPFEIELVAD